MCSPPLPATSPPAPLVLRKCTPSILTATPRYQSNTRFYAAKDAVLQSLPEGGSAEQREHALSAFYARWVAQERTRLDAYNSEWRKRNWSTILLGARVRYQEFISRVMHPFRGRQD